MRLLILLLLISSGVFAQRIEGKEVITSGTATTVSRASGTVVVNPSSVLANHTITLPADPVDRQEITFLFGGTITAGNPVVTSLSIVPDAAHTILQTAAPTIGRSGDCIVYWFDRSQDQWYKKASGKGEINAIIEIGLGAITNAHLADVSTATFKGRNTGGTGDVEDLSVGTLKTLLSVDNVTNTSDANKPVSTAQQTALDLKANLISPVFTTPNLGTPSAAVLTNATGLPVGSLTGLGANVGTWLATPSSANLAAAVTGETGSGALVFGTSPDFTTGATIGGVAIVTISSTNTFTGKSISLTTNTLTGSLAEFNTALSGADFATLAGSETLTGKTFALGSNTFSGTLAEFNTALTSADFATLAGSEALTNKTFALGSNTFTGTIAEFNTAVTDANFATLAGTEALTNKQITTSASTASAGTAGIKMTSGTNMTTAEAGAFEYDGVNTYITNETTAGRGAIPVEQYFHLITAGSTISTIANYFGATSNIPLVANAYYEIDIYLFYLKTTASAVTWTLTNSSAPTSMNIIYEMSPAAGIVAPPGGTSNLNGQIYNSTSASQTVVTASLTTGVNHFASFKIFLRNGSGTSLQIRATSASGSITPGTNSYWICKRRAAGNVGTFAN